MAPGPHSHMKRIKSYLPSKSLVSFCTHQIPLLPFEAQAFLEQFSVFCNYVIMLMYCLYNIGCGGSAVKIYVCRQEGWQDETLIMHNRMTDHYMSQLWST